MAETLQQVLIVQSLHQLQQDWRSRVQRTQYTRVHCPIYSMGVKAMSKMYFIRTAYDDCLAQSKLGTTPRVPSHLIESGASQTTSTAYHEPRTGVKFLLNPQIYTAFFLIRLSPLISGHAVYAFISVRRRRLAIVCLFRRAEQSTILLLPLMLGPLQVHLGLILHVIWKAEMLTLFARQCRYSQSTCHPKSGQWAQASHPSHRTCLSSECLAVWMLPE